MVFTKVGDVFSLSDSCVVGCVYSFSAISPAFLCVLKQQTRSLLSVFEEDSGMLTNYTNQLLQALQRVFGAQVGNQEVHMFKINHFFCGLCLCAPLHTSLIILKVLQPTLRNILYL